MSAIVYRRMTERDLAAAHALSGAVRWSHRREDWAFMLAAGTGFVAEEEGVLAGTGLCWKYGAADGALGMVIVAPERQGIGRELMHRILEELDGRSIALTATPAGQPLYEKLGFVPSGGVVQHQGTLRHAPAAQLSTLLAAGEQLRPLDAADLPALSALALRALGMPRDAVLAALQNVAEGVVLEMDGAPLGFSMIRPFGLGHMIGPVVAPDAGRARALIEHWTAAYAGATVRLDVSADSGLSPWAESLGLASISPSVRMTRGQSARPDGSMQQYAILNQAMG